MLCRLYRCHDKDVLCVVQVIGCYSRGRTVTCCAGRTRVTTENVLCVVRVVQVLRLRTCYVLCRSYKCYD